MMTEAHVDLHLVNDFGHVVDLEGGVGTFASEISGPSGFIVMDCMAMKARLDNKVVLDRGKKGDSRFGSMLFSSADPMPVNTHPSMDRNTSHPALSSIVQQHMSTVNY
ncbi:hypothetical protein BGZ51_008926 [Haplosporangium sp. Z 767]|nr:hypothetical protein BGZ51_008926 [Haplosporangium sp. Z 767]